jgi:hypothetical protein
MVSIYSSLPAKSQFVASQGSLKSSDVPASLSLPESKISLLEMTGLLSNASRFVMGFLLLFSPLIAKKGVPVARLIRKTLLKAGLRLSPDKNAQLTKLLSDRFTFQTFLKKSIFAISLLSASNNLYMGIQNKQPSMFVAGMLDLLLGVLGIRFPGNHYLWTASGLRAALFNSGKYNELANYNHPSYRQEWDIRRLNPFLVRPNGERYTRNLIGFLKFIAADLRQAVSFKPWQQFLGNSLHKKAWTSPQPELSAINAQLNLTSWLLATGGLASGKKWIQMMAIPIILTADAIYSLLISTRALQNSKDIDGKLVLVGAPLALAGLAFQPNLTKKYFFLNGMSFLGSALATIGVVFNGKKHGYMVDTLKMLHQQAVGNPNLKASDILSALKRDPKLIKLLQKEMGTNRFLFFLQTLQNANAQSSQIPFAQYLNPIAKSYGH